MKTARFAVGEHTYVVTFDQFGNGTVRFNNQRDYRLLRYGFNNHNGQVYGVIHVKDTKVTLTLTCTFQTEAT